MSKPPYAPPKVWRNDAASGGQFASINRPIAGATAETAGAAAAALWLWWQGRAS